MSIFIPDWQAIPWHKYNVHMHLEYSPRLQETTLVLFTKDHQKVIKLTDEEYENLKDRNNWELNHKREWQKELKTLYENRGD